MARKIAKSLDIHALQREWRYSRRGVPCGCRVIYSPEESRHQHWAWGSTTHRGAKCPQCRKELTSVWNLDLADDQLPEFFREAFAPLNRLPFYFCFPCASTAYFIVDDERIRSFAPPGDDESPYEEFHGPLEQRPINLELMPSEIDALITLSDDIGFRLLDESAVRKLRRHFRIKLDSDYDFTFSQIGGQPNLLQGHQQHQCPNAKCPASKIEYPYPFYHVPFVMKELAVTGRDAAPEFAETYTQIAWHLCPVCLTIRGDYRCT